jgi:hypothetical protein
MGESTCLILLFGFDRSSGGISSVARMPGSSSAKTRRRQSQFRRRCRYFGASHSYSQKHFARSNARQVEEAFEAKLTAINGQSNSASLGDRHDVPQAQPTNGEVASARLAATGQAAEAIDKSELTHPEPRRIRDKDHLRFVSTQPCLICGRKPADPHHLRFAQNRALGQKGQRRVGRCTLSRPSSRGSSPR